MRKLKQSSALLLIVSLLLSIFSLSASALEGTARINFHPRLLKADQAAQVRFNYDGTLQQGVPGEETKEIRYKLYRIADANTSRNDVEHDNNVIGNGPNGIDIDGKTIQYYGDPIVKELHQSEGYIDLPANRYGLYYVVVEDMLGEGRKGEPVIISVPSTKENGEINDNVHIYSKIIAKEHKVTVRKLVNGLELDNPNQGPHIRHGNYVMKFRLMKKINGQWKDVGANGQVQNNREIFSTEGRNGNYGMRGIDGLTNGEYKIVETEFLVSEHDGNIQNVLNQLGKGNLYDVFKLNDKAQGRDGLIDQNANMTEQLVEKTFELTGQDNDVVVDVDNTMRPQITKFIMDGNDKYVVKGVNPGEDINYRLEVGKPYVFGQNNQDVNRQAFGQLLNNKYNMFRVLDNELVLNHLITRDANENDLNVYFVDDNGRHLLQSGADFNVVFANGDGRSILIDFKINNQGFSNAVIDYLYNNRENYNAHFEIDFKVKVKDNATLAAVDNFQRANSGDDLINNQVRVRDLLSIYNTAKIILDENTVVNSNAVKSQLGFMKVRKTDDNGNPLRNAKFKLIDSAGVEIGEETSNENGWLYFAVPVGEDVRFVPKNDYLHHRGIGIPLENNQGEMLRFSRNMAMDEFLLNEVYFSNGRLAVNARQYQLRETQAPDGYEIIKQPLNISMDALIKELNVTNHPRVELPFTGGMGTILFTVVGILLIGSGAYLLINAKRKKSF